MKKWFNKVESFFKKDNKLKIIRESFIKYIKNNILFLSYIIISIIMATLLRAFTVGLNEVKSFFTDLSIIIFIGSFGYLIKPNKRYIYYLSFITFNSLLSVINAIYYEFFLSYVSVTLLPAIGQIGGVSEAIWTKVNYLSFIYLIFPLIYILIYRYSLKNNYIDKTNIVINKKEFIVTNIFSVLYLIIILFLVMGNSDYNRLKQQWNRESIIKHNGVYIYTINDIIWGVQPKISSLFNFDESYREFREFYNEKEVQTKNKYTGLFKGKNILFIHMESIQTFLVDLKINGEEITPYMNKLIKDSKYYSNFYPQISVGTSSDTEFTLLTSLMPANSGTVFVSYADRTFLSMPMLFKDKGYYVFSAHGNNADYWNRRIMHKNLGYDKFYAKDSFEMDEWTYMGLSDKSFFRQMKDKLKDISSNNKKYFGTLITLTNHTPWAHEDIFKELDLTMEYQVIEDGKKVNKTSPWLTDTEIGRYLTAVHYTDEALGEFIESLDKEGLLDNTVLVLYGDHTAKIGMDQYNLLYNYNPETDSIKNESDETYVKYDKYDHFLNNKTPLIIYSKNSDFKGEEKNVMGMYDVLPTITNLFGTEYSKYALGHDYYSNNEHVVIFPNGNFITNKVYYNSIEDRFITLTDEAIDSSYIERLKDYTEKRIKISNLILSHDLIKYELESSVGEKDE